MRTRILLFSRARPHRGAHAPPAARPRRPVEGRHGRVRVAAGVRRGRLVLAKGGNAVDAAVATAFALAVTYPAAGNIGGGGFMMVRPPAGDATTFEYRETAPRPRRRRCTSTPTDRSFAASRPPATSRRACPAPSAGWRSRTREFGKLPWKDVVAPAVKLAPRGFTVDAGLAARAQPRAGRRRRRRSPSSSGVYGKPGGGAVGGRRQARAAGPRPGRCGSSPRRAGRVLHRRIADRSRTR